MSGRLLWQGEWFLFGGAFFFLILETIYCYNEAEIKDSTETGEVDRIWLNLIKSSREVRVNQTKSMNGEARDLG